MSSLITILALRVENVNKNNKKRVKEEREIWDLE